MMNCKNRLIPGCLLLVVVTAVAGCDGRYAPETPPDLPEICPAPCNVDLTLPEGVDELPRIPEVTRVVGGTEVNFRVPHGGQRTSRTERRGQGTARTVLSFEEPAFVDGQGNPLYTLELTAGNNRYTTQSSKAGVCQPPDGCRYVVINVGHPGRPSIISSPHVIIE